MKDATASKRSRSNSDVEENDSKRGSDVKEKAEKQKRKKLRKRRGSSSPEEDVIDGFVIASYASLRCLEVTQIVTSNTPDCLPVLDQDQNEEPIEAASQAQETGDEIPKLSTKNKEEETSEVKESKNATVKKITDGDVPKPEIDLSRQSPGQITDDSSDSGNSGKGYICDGESEDEQVSEVPPEKRSKSSLTSVPEIKKDIVPINLDLVKDDDEETVKNEKSFELSTRKSIVSPKSSSFHTPSLSFLSSSSLSISQSSRSVPQSSWLPRLSSSSFKKPLAGVDPCCRTAPYSGTDVLHQELNNRFLQSHSDLERNHQHAKPSDHELHQHSHLHHHQHQHQHTHYYPSPLLAPPYYPTPTPVPGLSPFSTPVPTYGSHMLSPFSKKTGKWCAAHVQIAWKIYCHQRVQGEISKDPHGKPEGNSISKPTTTIIPPFPSRHVAPGDLGYHSHSSRFSVSPFGRPPVLIPRSSGTSTTTVTSSTSAFSSVSSPLLAARRMGSPVAISRASSESHGKRSPISGPSPLYPWLKSEPKIPDLDSEKSKDHSKRGFQTKSPPRPSNFSIQSLASERAEIRPSLLGDSTRTHSSREHRPCETRSFLDNPLVPSLGSLDKRPIDYRPSAGSIDLNRNSLYGRFEPMPTLYPHHVTPMTPHISGYPYPSSSFLTDYHSAPRHPMVLGTRDPMTSLVRTSDAPFFIMHDFDDRLGGRH